MKRRFTFRRYLLLIPVACTLAGAHKAWAQDDIPLEERLRKNPLPASATHLESGEKVYRDSCAGCHGMDGKPKPQTEKSIPAPQGDLSDFRMESIRDGEIYWVVTHGIENFMAASEGKLSDTQRWEVVLYIRELRARRKAIEIAQLGPYPWKLPVGFPYPNVPADNPMTPEKVELGRYLFYDQRLSLNQTQSCASCHKQKLAFTDGRPRGVGSTGELHPRGAMSLANVAYSPALTWANPNIHQLEQQALLPMFGENPIELGMSGKGDAPYRKTKGGTEVSKAICGGISERMPILLPWQMLSRQLLPSSAPSFLGIHPTTDMHVGGIQMQLRNPPSGENSFSSVRSLSASTAMAGSISRGLWTTSRKGFPRSSFTTRAFTT